MATFKPRITDKGRRKEGIALFNPFVFKFVSISRKRETKKNELENEQTLFFESRLSSFPPQ